MKIILWLTAVDHSSTFASSSDLVSTFIDGMIRYVLFAYLHRKFPGLTTVKSLELMT